MYAVAAVARGRAGAAAGMSRVVGGSDFMSAGRKEGDYWTHDDEVGVAPSPPVCVVHASASSGLLPVWLCVSVVLSGRRKCMVRIGAVVEGAAAWNLGGRLDFEIILFTFHVILHKDKNATSLWRKQSLCFNSMVVLGGREW